MSIWCPVREDLPAPGRNVLAADEKGNIFPAYVEEETGEWRRMDRDFQPAADNVCFWVTNLTGKPVGVRICS